MGSKYFEAGTERAGKVHDLFAAIAPRYDLINDLQSFGLHRVWKRRLIRLAAVRAGERALDVCCGTGDLAFALADAGAEVTGLDFSEPMLAVARVRGAPHPRAIASEAPACNRFRRGKSAGQAGPLPPDPPSSAAAGLWRDKSDCGGAGGRGGGGASRLPVDSAQAPPGNKEGSPHPDPLPSDGRGRGASRLAPHSALRNPQFLQGDALQIPFPEAQFEVVTVGYGLRNLSSWERGLEEMWRVAKPGGRLLVLDFGKPDNALWRALYFSYLRWLVPLFGKVLCRDSEAYRYILESLRNYPAQRGVEMKLCQMGCVEVSTRNLLGGVMSISYGRKTVGQ